LPTILEELADVPLGELSTLYPAMAAAFKRAVDLAGCSHALQYAAVKPEQGRSLRPGDEQAPLKSAGDQRFSNGTEVLHGARPLRGGRVVTAPPLL